MTIMRRTKESLQTMMYESKAEMSEEIDGAGKTGKRSAVKRLTKTDLLFTVALANRLSVLK